MTAEAIYEAEWVTCSDCGTRRPRKTLTDGKCIDGWHVHLMRFAREILSVLNTWERADREFVIQTDTIVARRKHLEQSKRKGVRR